MSTEAEQITSTVKYAERALDIKEIDYAEMRRLVARAMRRGELIKPNEPSSIVEAGIRNGWITRPAQK